MMTHPQLIEFLKQRVGLCKDFCDDRLDQTGEGIARRLL